ncbi:Hint domain-containing protein [Shimia sp. W99]
MPLGYLVQLGDYSLDISDSIVDPRVRFDTDSYLGSGTWEWSGSWGNSTYINEIEPGDYYLATDGNVYFVPSYGPVAHLDAATVNSAPSYATYDGLVEGTAGDDIIDASFTDINGDSVDGGTGTGASGLNDSIQSGAGNDSIQSGLGDDTIDAGADNDTVEAGAGNDVIYGDGLGSETLDWSAQGTDGTDVFSGFTQNTGDIDVTLSFSNDGNNAATANLETTDTIYRGADEDFDPNSSLLLFGNGDGSTSTTTFDFAAAAGANVEDEVLNVAFRISDIDWASGNHQDIVTINAYDADGNPVEVVITPGANDTVSGNTITAGTAGESASDASGSALIEIAGPVSQVEIIYANGLGGTQGIWVSNLEFQTMSTTGGNDSLDGGEGDDVIVAGGGDDTIIGGEGDDRLIGGTGNDLIYGNGGNDTLVGAAGNDTLDGGADNDLLRGGSGEDVLFGGAGADTLRGGNDNDTLYVGQGDQADGGQGDDTFIITDTGDTGEIVIVGGESGEINGDTLNLNGLADRSTLVITNPDDSAGGLSGTVELLDGTLVRFFEIENIICFTPGTRILTEHGERNVETLRAGDLVMTKDDGLQPIRWIGNRTVPADGKFAPVAVTSAMLPDAKRTLLVSPQHRFLISGWRAEMLFGEAEVLVSATHMDDGERAFRLPRSHVTYVHVMLDRHQIIYAEGVETESFHAADTGVAGLGEDERESMFETFPHLRENLNAYGPTARRCLKKHEADALLASNGGVAPRLPRRRATPQRGPELTLI